MKGKLAIVANNLGSEVEDVKKKITVPKIPAAFRITKEARKVYNYLAPALAGEYNFKETDMPSMIILCETFARWLWVREEIQRKNEKKMGKGLIQKFKSGATNITTEYKIMMDCEDQIIKLSKILGLSIRDRKEISGELETTGQLNLLEQFFGIKKAN